MPKEVAKKRAPAVVALVRLAASDGDVRLICARTVERFGTNGLVELAAKHPKVFDELNETCLDLVEQAPQQWIPGGRP